MRSYMRGGSTRWANSAGGCIDETLGCGERCVSMTRGQLEAFSDGVIAIIITIMVLEMKVPHGSGLEGLAPLLPVFLSYVLSFVPHGLSRRFL